MGIALFVSAFCYRVLCCAGALWVAASLAYAVVVLLLLLRLPWLFALLHHLALAAVLSLSQVAGMLGYSNEDNPFGDTNLSSQFVWHKKQQKEQVETGARWFTVHASGP
jgi:hypothetical protein